MKLCIFIFSMLIFVQSEIWSQSIIIDSLNQKLINESDVYERIDIHLGLARAFAFSRDRIQSEKNIDLALELSLKHQWPEATISAYIFKAVVELNKGNGSDILYFYVQKALKLSEEIGSSSGLAFANYHLAEYYILDKNDPQKGLEVVKDALKKVDSFTAHKHIGNIYKTQGLAYKHLGQKDKVLESYEKALYHFEKVKELPYIDKRLGHISTMDLDNGLLNSGQVLNHLSDLYTQNGDYEKALDYSERAITMYHSIKAINEEANCKKTRASAYEQKGDLIKAIRDYQEAILVFEKNGYHLRLLESQLSLGQLFYRTKAYKPAMENFSKAKLNSLFTKDSVNLIHALSWIGKTALAQGNSDDATLNLEEALSINNRLGSGGEKAELLTHLSEVRLQQKNYKEAIQLNKEALFLNRQKNAFNYTQNNLTNLANLYSTITQLDSALQYGHLSLENSHQYGSVEQKIELQEVLAEINEKTGNFEAATKFHKKHFELFNKTYNDRAQKLLKNEQVRQDIAGVEAEKRQVEMTANLLASRNRLYLLLALSLGLILLLGGYLFYQLRKTKRQLESQNLQLHNLNATKDKFFGIIAHDIRSPIVALDGVGEQMEYYLKKNNPEKLKRLSKRVDSTAKRLGALLDNLLKWALLQQGVIPYHPKILNVREMGINIFDMFQNNADAKNITLLLSVEAKQMVFADESSLSTILRNVVSNAIKFTPNGGAITLSSETKDENIFIHVQDTGTGISPEKLSKLFSLDRKSEKGTAGEKGTGLGLTLVHELTLLNKGTIDVESVLNKGTHFKIGLPVNG